MNNDIIELYFKDTINIPFIFTYNNGAANSVTIRSSTINVLSQ